MKSQIAFLTFVAIVLLECIMVLAQFDYGPPVVDETQKPVDSTEIKCLGLYMRWYTSVNSYFLYFVFFFCPAFSHIFMIDSNGKIVFCIKNTRALLFSAYSLQGHVG